MRSRASEVASIEAFLNWLGPGRVARSKVTEYAEEMLAPCDTAIMHGPGHQSISPCNRTGVHEYHSSDLGHEWTERNIGRQTHTQHAPGDEYGKPRTGPVLRLASSGFEY